MEHQREVIICYIKVHFRKSVLIAYYNGTLMHTNLYAGKQMVGSRRKECSP